MIRPEKAVSRISTAQFVMLLLAGRISTCLLVSDDTFSDFSVTDSILSALLQGAFLFLLCLPTILLLNRHRDRGLVGLAYDTSRAAGIGVGLFYLVLCLFILCLDIVQLLKFTSKILKTEVSASFLSLAFIAVCFLAAFYGIQALGRTATLVTVFSILCLLVFGATLLPQMRLLHFPPNAVSGIPRLVEKALWDLPRTSEIVAIGLLYPYVNGSLYKGCAVFSGITSVLSATVAITAVAVLGDYAAMTAYPYYAAVTAAQLGVFERLDVLVTAVWMSTYFVRFTLFCMLFVNGTRRLFGKSVRTPAALFGIGALAVFTFCVQHVPYEWLWKQLVVIFWWVLVAVCFVLPLLLLLMQRLKRRQYLERV